MLSTEPKAGSAISFERLVGGAVKLSALDLSQSCANLDESTLAFSNTLLYNVWNR